MICRSINENVYVAVNSNNAHHAALLPTRSSFVTNLSFNVHSERQPLRAAQRVNTEVKKKGRQQPSLLIKARKKRAFYSERAALGRPRLVWDLMASRYRP